MLSQIFGTFQELATRDLQYWSLAVYFLSPQSATSRDEAIVAHCTAERTHRHGTNWLIPETYLVSMDAYHALVMVMDKDEAWRELEESNDTPGMVDVLYFDRKAIIFGEDPDDPYPETMVASHSLQTAADAIHESVRVKCGGDPSGEFPEMQARHLEKQGIDAESRYLGLL